jgi:aminoglycoside phosphotransferase family enzyme/predicted kinase
MEQAEGGEVAPMDGARLEAEPDQHPVVEFLSRPDSYGAPVDRVEVTVTHISRIFLAGDRAYKLKRAVRLPYVDFSTLERRRAACERELALNRRTAPDLYQAVLPVVRTQGGALVLGGPGEALDWVVAMRRFDETLLLDHLAREGNLSPEILRALGDTIAAFHAQAEPRRQVGGASLIDDVIAGNAEAFANCPADAFDPALIDRLQDACRARLEEVSAALDRRCDAGKVRICHGDLHLRNICLMDGRPVPFDCIEFSDALITIDVLYDLAFLLMDLLHRGLQADANAVFNRYLDRADEDDGLGALPLFMALRAAIRAHVTASAGAGAGKLEEAQAYANLALRLLEPAPPRLIAIGGLSGTGKSTLAYRLAPGIGRIPGARVIRSDVIRKGLFGVAPETRLNPDAYGSEVTSRVYATMTERTAVVLAGGHAAIADAVFARPEERAAIGSVAQAAAVPFTGMWLEAPAGVLEQRVSGRRNDASDADAEIVHRQLGFETGPVDWARVDASKQTQEIAASVSDWLG